HPGRDAGWAVLAEVVVQDRDEAGIGTAVAGAEGVAVVLVVSWWRRSKRMALTITTRTEASWTSIPMDMVTPPSSTPASSTATVIRAMVMFWRMLFTVRRARPTASGSMRWLSPQMELYAA